MSLIVAKKNKNNIYIVGDTRISNTPDILANEKYNPFEGVLKSVILNANLCVSFAGVVDYADEALVEFKKNNYTHHTKIIKYFLDFHKRYNEQVEFIISFGLPILQIVSIKNGRAEKVNSTWIGDIEAFNDYQTHFHTKKEKMSSIENLTIHKNGPELMFSMDKDRTIPEKFFFAMNGGEIPMNGDETLNLMLAALKKVNENSKIISVGDFTTSIICDNNGFRFSHHLSILTHEIQQLLNGGLIPFGYKEQGGYAVSFNSAESEGVQLATIYILQARIGIIYKPLKGGILRPIVLKNIPLSQFLEVGKNEYNLDYIDTFFSEDL